MTVIIPGDQATDREVVGGKAANLARLAAAGFDVPEFFVLPDAAFEHPKLEPELTAALSQLGAGPYAVRSSGRDEDGALNSHAGQFDTFLNVAAAEVLEKALAVRASSDGATVATYRDLRGLEGDQPPSVVVQRMVPARIAGIAFSADPVSGLRGNTVISATTGLGEQLVGGEVDGEGWTVDHGGHILNAPQKPTVLTPAEAQDIATLARDAEAAFGHPQDIEWAYDGDRLRMLQSRDITTQLRPAPNADDALVVFDNSNIVESYPGLVSPLTYSFASYCYDRVYRGFVGLLGLSDTQISANAPIFANLLARVDGRVYYNLGNWYRALALLPGFSLNRGYMETMMGVSEPLPQELTQGIGPAPATGWHKAVELLRLTRVALGLATQAVLLPRTKRRFLERLQGSLTHGPDLNRANLTELAQAYRTIESALLDRWDAPLVNDFLCMIGFGASRKMLERWAGPKGLTFHNDIMIGQGDIISAEPAQRIARMSKLVRDQNAATALAEGRAALEAYPEIAAEFDDYIAAFGDRCTQELKLESIPLTDDPSTLIAAISAGAARAPVTPKTRDEPDWTALMPTQPVRRTIARRFSNWARARVRDRENLRFERTRIFGHARRVFLAMGRELHARGDLDAPRDIFFLTVPEVLGAVEGAGMSRNIAAIAALRKAEMETAETRPDPPERITLRGAAINAGAHSAPPPSVAPQAGDRRTGTGCSAGRITGRARVIHDPRTESLHADEILVARNTDPGWIAVFANASAIVVERGSLLSHSAIVAREMGIPCVVGIGDATQWITSGEVIDVDGATGEVRKIND
ncbi:PEP/pyruvate-binding domain-containing protein [Actibacterium lipolyticum]|uniref:Chondramide synthase cmdD n=1 Tax=Actibacterium lipolyticum TaxID=1524263 RepID=A0A238KU44_9RHOB|nr:PEP/pyruvate-binding domain-containing protein [Actibacterium lipolyticum]SMX45682.1 Chondramide synthase cmdD [Actibacterium lipolyticum]